MAQDQRSLAQASRSTVLQRLLATSHPARLLGLPETKSSSAMSKVEWLVEKICTENALAQQDWQSRIGNMESKIMAKFEVISNTQSLLIVKFENAKVDDQQKGVEMDLMIEKIEQLTAMVERVGEQNAGVKNSLQSLANRMERVAQLEDRIDYVAGAITEMRRTLSIAQPSDFLTHELMD